jgi:chromate transporter
MEHEIVGRRGWLSRQHFLDLIAATYLIPGHNAIEMANHVGYQRAGLPGLIVAGVAFTLPGALISAGLAWGYVRFGTLPQLEPFLGGIKPVVLGIMLAAIWRLGKTAWKSWQLALIGVAVAAASLARYDDITALLVGSLIGGLFLRWSRRGPGRPGQTGGSGDQAGGSGQTVCGAIAAAGSTSSAGRAVLSLAAGAGAVPAAAAAVSLWKLALFFLEVGAALYGGGYVLVAYLQGGLVDEYHWLSNQQLLDAVAVGQITPGPLISTVTFVGYLVAQFPGAAVATVAILVPSFVFVAAVNPWIPRLRRSPWASLLLDAVGAASIGLGAAVTIKLGQTTLAGWPAVVLATTAAVVQLRWRVPPAYLILAGAIAGRLLY